MRTDPFSDTLELLLKGGWPIYLFWSLLLASTAIAIYNFRRYPEQRTVKDLWAWFARITLGAMWWQQTLWKLPPHYTEMPAVENSGLKGWVIEMVNHAAFGVQSDFVRDVVLPHFNFFAAQVYAVEVIVAVSLMLGLLTRAGAVIGALMAINLWLGLYRASYEWPWTYFFLMLLQFTFAAVRAGRSLGVDAILARKLPQEPGYRSAVARMLAFLT